ncbi:MAG: hypothetical protein KTR30_18855 [Saprospiraceae bacterium]|nr:hypothetical protein [Saprospiraceae bacterium]
MRKWPTYHHLLAGLFGAVILLYWVDRAVELLPVPALQEKRKLAEKPVLNPSFLDPFPKDYESYYNDHFHWRNGLIRLKNYINYYTFKQSNLPEEVLIGQQDWLFKSGFQLDIYTGKFQFTIRDLEGIAAELQGRKSEVEAAGGKYYLCIPPQKHSIYPEYLPKAVQRYNAQTCTEQLVDYLAEHTDIDYIDLFGPIRDRKERTDSLLYHVTDHHWNDITALLAAKEILNYLRKDFPSLGMIKDTDYKFNYAEFDGMTLAQMLGIEQEVKERAPVLTPMIQHEAKDSIRQYVAPHDFPFKSDYVVDKRIVGSSAPALFMVRESFASATILPLSEHFSRSFYLFDNWKHNFNAPIFEAEQPDIYIQMVWEGLIFNLMNNPPADAKW